MADPPEPLVDPPEPLVDPPEPLVDPPEPLAEPPEPPAPLAIGVWDELAQPLPMTNKPQSRTQTR